MAVLRDRPYVQFNFLVDLGDGNTEGPEAGFQEISGIGMEVTLSVLGLSDVTVPTIGTTIFWANQHQALVAGVWWWLAAPIGVAVVLFLGLYLLFSSVNEFIDPRTRLRRIGA